MERKPAFEFKPDTQYKVELSFDEPKTGSSAKGDWFLYGAKIDGSTESFFAPEKLHNKIQEMGFKKGSKFILQLTPKINPTTNKAYKELEIFLNGNTPTTIKEEDKKWEKIRNEKNDSIAWMNAKNNATQLVSSMINKGLITEISGVRLVLLDWANWFYCQEPNPTSKQVREFEKETGVTV